MTPSPNFLTTFDDTLPVLPNFSPAPASVAPVQSTGSISPSSSASNSTPSSGTGNSGGFSSFFGTRGIAIILGLIFIAGSILLFLGDDIAGAVKVASRVAA